MKFSTTLASAAALAITVTAGPVAKVNPIKNLPENGVHLDKVEVIKDIPPEGVHITELDTLSTLSVLATGTTANDYLNGGCKDVILFYARGSTQAGNMGDQPGPQTADGLISSLGSSKIAIQGVPYGASLLTNVLPGGCDSGEAKDFATMLSGAASKCPSSKLVVSGYSQGAALVHAAVEQLSSTVRARIYAAVTFGDTQKQQDGGKIPNYDASRTLILCNDGDLVCEGTLVVTSAHLSYTSKVPTAVSFIVSKVK